jgi:hypothetical protein
MNEIRKATLGKFLFKFDDFDNWCDTAREKFSDSGHKGEDTVCMDEKGRVCKWGEHFMRARDDNSFPIRVYSIRTEFMDKD